MGSSRNLQIVIFRNDFLQQSNKGHSGAFAPNYAPFAMENKFSFCAKIFHHKK